MSVKINTYKFFKNGNHQLSCGSHKHSITKKLLILVAAFTLSSGVFAQDMKMEKDMMDKDMKMKKGQGYENEKGWRQDENGYGRNEELAYGFSNGSKRTNGFVRQA
jgi:nitrate reductase cytochrome c-type subunit